MSIQKAQLSDISIIQSIAYDTWPITYKEIISQAQIEYMLNLYYNTDILTSQFIDPFHSIWIYKYEEDVVGYIHYVVSEKFDQIKLSKLYVLPSSQGKAIGNTLLVHLEIEALKLNIHSIILNVNRNNPAKDFYIKNGYQILEKIDIPLEQYWLNDFVMQKTI